MNKPIDTEDKLSYCEFGVEKEKEFLEKVAPSLSLNITLNPQKLTNKYAPDLLVDGDLADLKTQLVPFFTAGRYKKDPQYTVTINKKDLVRYWRLYRGITIFFWVSFQEEERYNVKVAAINGVWKTTLDDLLELKNQDKLPLHAYINRKTDTKGNAKDSYLVDVRDLERVA